MRSWKMATRCNFHKTPFTIFASVHWFYFLAFHLLGFSVRIRGIPLVSNVFSFRSIIGFNWRDLSFSLISSFPRHFLRFRFTWELHIPAGYLRICSPSRYTFLKGSCFAVFGGRTCIGYSLLFLFSTAFGTAIRIHDIHLGHTIYTLFGGWECIIMRGRGFVYLAFSLLFDVGEQICLIQI